MATEAGRGNSREATMILISAWLIFMVAGFLYAFDSSKWAFYAAWSAILLLVEITMTLSEIKSKP
jgi:hypothetical protein